MQKQDVIGIFDMDKTTLCCDTRDMLLCAQKRGEIVAATKELPRSFVLCSRRGKVGAGGVDAVYLTKVSVPTLLKKNREGISDD